MAPIGGPDAQPEREGTVTEMSLEEEGRDVERAELIDFLFGRIDAEFALAAGARPSPDRDACFQRIGAYADVLAQLDPERAAAVLRRVIEAY
jgi:hypothetical protein